MFELMQWQQDCKEQSLQRQGGLGVGREKHKVTLRFRPDRWTAVPLSETGNTQRENRRSS